MSVNRQLPSSLRHTWVKPWLWLLWPMLLLSGCAVEAAGNTAFILDTVATLQIEGLPQEKTNELIGESFALCREYENMLSRTKSESEVSRLNSRRDSYVEVSQETLEIVQKSLYYSELSDGSFDITIKPLVDLWDINGKNPSKPADEQITAALNRVGYQNILIRDNSIALRNDAQIDLGAIAKGYIADKVKEYLTANGCESALINLGGNVLAIGARPDGKPWRIGIQEPFAADGVIAGVVEITDCSVVTSGSYQRYFEEDGIIYHHILDPRTGYPADQILSSVTIITKLSVDADALSTACFVLGLEKGMELLEEVDGAEGIFITADHKIFTTYGIGRDIVFQKAES